MTISLHEAFAEATLDPTRIDGLAPDIRHAKLKATDNCNSRCITCTYWQEKQENELTLDEIRRVMGELRHLGAVELMFTGGEPTLRRDLSDMVARAASLGFSSIGMTTNGLSLSEPKIDHLLDSGLGEVVLSLEGLTLHDEIRGVPGNVDKILRHLDVLGAKKAQAYPELRICLATTLMDRTLAEIPGIVDLARSTGATLFCNLIDSGTYFFRSAERSLFTISDWGLLEETIDRLVEAKKAEPGLIGNSLPSLAYARRYFADPKQAQIPCYLGYVGVEVDANGAVYSNCWGLPPMGNVRQTPLAEIVNSEAYRRRCAAMYRKECAGCSCGYILNLAYHPETAALNAAGRGPEAAASTGYAGERLG